MTEESLERGDAPERPEPGLRMRFGTDLKYHFEDPELRKKGKDTAAFEWIETTFLDEDFNV